MKYSDNYQRDYDFYLSNISNFNFCGTLVPKHKSINNPKGKKAKEVFYSIDTHGKNIGCSEPELLDKLLLCKSAVNFQIKQWAEARLEGTLPLSELSIKHYEKVCGEKITDNIQQTLCWVDSKPVYYKDIQTQYNLPDWVIEAVENQKIKYYKN